jgi:hypothetical protein
MGAKKQIKTQPINGACRVITNIASNINAYLIEMSKYIVTDFIMAKIDAKSMCVNQRISSALYAHGWAVFLCSPESLILMEEIARE